MDFEILFWILILLAPLLSRLLRGQKQKQQRPPLPRQPAPSNRPVRRELTPFEEALQQIQEALSQSQQSTSPTREPAQPEPVRREMPVQKPTRAVPTSRSGFRPHAPPTYEEKPRFFDDEFEQKAFDEAPGRDVHYHEPLSDESDQQTTEHRKKSRMLTKWQRTVANIEVLSSPRSRRPWSSPWSK